MRKNTDNNPVAAYEVVQMGEKLELIEGQYALSKKELEKRENIIFSCDGRYKIVRDKNGNIVRLKDNRTFSEVSKDNVGRLIEEFKNREGKGQDK